MDNFTLKIKLDRVLGKNLLLFFSIVLILFCAVNAGQRTDSLYVSGGLKTTRATITSAGIGSLSLTLADIDSIYDGLKLAGDLSINGRIYGTGSSYLAMQTNTSDGSDNKFAAISGGGDYSGGNTRGGYIEVHGNEAGSPGGVRLIPGVGNGTTSGAIYMGGKTYWGTRPTSDNYWQIALGQYFSMYSASAYEDYITHNAYYSSGWKYRESTANSGANIFRMGAGYFVLGVAPTGTQGATITWKFPFYTDSTGRVNIGDSVQADSTLKVTGSTHITSNLAVDGNINGGAISGTTGTFSGKVTAASANIAGACTTGTINTGSGNFEIGQNLRTTDNVTFNTVSNASGVINRVVDTSGSFACTLKTDCVTVQQIGTVTFRRVGGIVTLKFPKIEGTSNSNFLSLYCGIPSSLNPTGFQRCLLIARDNSSPVMAYAIIPNYSTITIARFDGAGFQNTGTKGLALDYMNITYAIN